MADAVDMTRPTEGHVLLSAYMKKRAVNPNPLNKLTGYCMFKERLSYASRRSPGTRRRAGRPPSEGRDRLNAHTLLEEYDNGSDDTTRS